MAVKPTTYTASQFINIYDGLKSVKSTMENHLQEINDNVMPNSSDVTTVTETPGRKKNQTMYDSTAGHSLNLLVKAIHAALTSSASQWFNIILKNKEIMEVKVIADWFSECSRTMFDFMVASNFHNEIQKTYKHMGGYGTTALACDEYINPRTREFEKLRYETWSIREFVFSEGGDELPTMIFRLHRMTADKANDRWSTHPRFKGFGTSIEGVLDDPLRRYKDRLEFLEVFYKRTDYEDAKKKNPMHMPWGYCVVGYKDKKKIVEGGKMEQSVAIGRWERNADDLGWGRCPAMEALPSIKTLNDIVQNGLKSLKKDLNPPLVISYKGVIGDVRTHDGGIIYKRKKAELETLDSGARYDAAQLYQAEFKAAIKEYFFVDQIQVGINDSKTLGEFQQRYELMMRLLGSTYGRLTYEVFSPTLYRTFNILLRNGKFPPMPDELVQIASNPNMAKYTQMDVEYTGPLARSQRIEEVNAIGAALNGAAAFVEVTQSPEALDWIDVDAAMKLTNELLGVPSEVRRTQDQVDQIRKDRSDAQAAQADLQQQGMEAEVAGAQADAAGKVVDINQRAAA